MPEAFEKISAPRRARLRKIGICLYFLWGFTGLVWGQNSAPVHPKLADMRLADRVAPKDIRDALKRIDSIANGTRWLEASQVKNLYARREYQPLFVADPAGLQN